MSDKKAVLLQGLRDAAAVRFGLKFADIHYKFKNPSSESQASELLTYRRKTVT